MTLEVLDSIVDYIIKAYEDSKLLGEARKAMVDTIAVAMAAPKAYSKSRSIVTNFIKDEEGPIPVLGLEMKASKLGSAVANAFLAHSLELDDWLAPGYVHAGSIAIPTALSYGYEKTMEEVLRAIAGGYEAGLQIGRYFGREHYNYYHGTATIGSVVAAVTYTLLAEGPSRQSLMAAVSLAVAYMGGLWTINRAKALYKPLSPSMAVKTGVLAAKTGTVEKKLIPGSIEHTCKLLRGRCEYLDGYGRALEINGYKFYPSCRHSHTIIEAALELHSKVRIEDIAHIRARLYHEAVSVAGIKNPTTIEEARFSIPFLVSASLVYGKVTLKEITKGLRDNLVRKLIDLVELQSSEDYTRQYPDKQPAELTVIMKNGNELHSFKEKPRGEPSRDVSLDEIMGKVMDLRDYISNKNLKIIYNIVDAGLNETLKSIFDSI